MPSILYGAGAYRRTNGNFPELKLVNMFLETGAQTSEQQMALISRQGLGQLATVGSGPIHGIFQHDFGNGDIFTLSDTALYKHQFPYYALAGTNLGSVAGTGPVSFAGGFNEVLVTRGSTIRSYNYSNLANVTFPDSAGVWSICFIGSLFVAARAGQTPNGRFYWSDPLDGRTWDALNFATAEREADYLYEVKALGDNLWLLGSSTIEAWAHTGDANLPFTRLENVFADHGIFGTGAACNAGGGLIYVSNDRIVRRLPEGERLSDHSIEERILQSDTCKLFAFKREGHEFVCVRLDDESLIYDTTTGQWCEFQTNGGQWIVNCAAMADQAGYFGHESTAQVMGWDEWDDLGVEMERSFTAVIPLDVAQSIDNVRLWANVGQTDDLTLDPLIEMRTSDDAGNTWSDWEDVSLGNVQLGGAGEYRTMPEWRALGMFDFPGAMLQFRVTDPVPFRISKVSVNDPGGGRER